MPDKTLGACCYAAWWQTRYGLQQADAASAYALLPPQDRRAWDAAALAVLAWEDLRQKHQDAAAQAVLAMQEEDPHA